MPRTPWPRLVAAPGGGQGRHQLLLLRAAALRHRRVGQGKCQCVAGYKGEGCEEEPPDLGGPLLVLMAAAALPSIRPPAAQ